MDKIEKIVREFKTKHKIGFIQSEVDLLLKDFPNINERKFRNALNNTTRMGIDDDVVIYHIDIEKALRCGLENRNLHFPEID